MRRDRGFLVALGALAVAALAVFFVVLLTLHGEARDEMVKEGGKAALQVFTVAVIGALLKQLADRYKEDRERDAQDRSFRQDKYDRLVEATNSLRAVRAFVYADKSFATWDAQMHQVVQAGLKLRTIKHQIWSSKSVPDPPFPDRRELTYLFEALYRYTDWVTDEYIDARASIEQASREAEAADTEIADGEVWRRIKSLKAIEDLDRLPDSNKVTDMAKVVDVQLADAVAVATDDDDVQGPVDDDWSWLRYEATEGLALERITRATLPRRRGLR